MILKNVSIKKYNTFGLDCIADNFISVKSEESAISTLKNSKTLVHPLLIIGCGSNILFTADFHGTIIHSEIFDINIEEQHPEYAIISSGSGMDWDNFVGWCVNSGFGGLENLSLIPGNVGAAPIQNIGAYGVEAKDSIEKVRAVSLKDGTITEFSNKDCLFSYRNSIFKGKFKGKYLITRVFFRLATKPIFNLDYGSIRTELTNPEDADLKRVREAVINIRRSKLPDPLITGNAGSFFKNPVVSRSLAEELKKKHTEIPLFEDQSATIKLAAGWLVEQCGWKGKRIGDAGVHDRQALVLVNHGKATGKEILNLSEAVKKSVREKFGVELEREVEVIGPI